MSIKPLRPLVGVLVAAALVVSGCGGGGNDSENDGQGQGESQEAGPEATLAEAKKVLDEADSVNLNLEGQNLPGDKDTLQRLSGQGTHQPAFKGDAEARLKGAPVTIPVVAIEDKFWMKLPFSPKFTEEDPATYGAPNPADLFRTEGGISDLLVKTKDPKAGEAKRDGRDVVQNITGKLDGEQVVDLLKTGKKDADYDVAYDIVEDSKEVRTVVITGPFYTDQPSTYTLKLDKYGEPVEITAP